MFLSGSLCCCVEITEDNAAHRNEVGLTGRGRAAERLSFPRREASVREANGCGACEDEAKRKTPTGAQSRTRRERRTRGRTIRPERSQATEEPGGARSGWATTHEGHRRCGRSSRSGRVWADGGTALPRCNPEGTFEAPAPERERRSKRP